jgi:hypothetical protein
MRIQTHSVAAALLAGALAEGRMAISHICPDIRPVMGIALN